MEIKRGRGGPRPIKAKHILIMIESKIKKRPGWPRPIQRKTRARRILIESFSSCVELPLFVLIVIAAACVVTVAIVGLLCMFLCKLYLLFALPNSINNLLSLPSKELCMFLCKLYLLFVLFYSISNLLSMPSKELYFWLTIFFSFHVTTHLLTMSSNQNRPIQSKLLAGYIFCSFK